MKQEALNHLIWEQFYKRTISPSHVTFSTPLMPDKKKRISICVRIAVWFCWVDTTSCGPTHPVLKHGVKNNINNKARHQRAERIWSQTRVQRWSVCILVFEMFDVLWNVTMQEREQEVKCPLAARRIMGRHFQWLPPSFMWHESIKTNHAASLGLQLQ